MQLVDGAKTRARVSLTPEAVYSDFMPPATPFHGKQNQNCRWPILLTALAQLSLEYLPSDAAPGTAATVCRSCTLVFRAINFMFIHVFIHTYLCVCVCVCIYLLTQTHQTKVLDPSYPLWPLNHSKSDE